MPSDTIHRYKHKRQGSIQPRIGQQLVNLCSQNQLHLLGYTACNPTHHEALLKQFAWGQSLVLIGWGSQGYGASFMHSPEYQDNLPDPMDRWSLRLGKAWAQTLKGVALWPFTGPPYWPFLTWAEAAGVSRPSRLGMHLHSQHGLWHSYRFALLLSSSLDDLQLDNIKLDATYHAKMRHNNQLPKTHTNGAASHSMALACLTCDAPCINACPVDAFAVMGEYKVDVCRQEVQQTLLAENQSAATCGQVGCLARQACPVVSSRYSREQMRYHMRTFL